jgi:hypothetical protein
MGPFESEAEYRIGLSAYYMMLNLIEFVTLVAGGKEDEIAGRGPTRLDVPVCVLVENAELNERACALLLRAGDRVAAIWRSRGIDDALVKQMWPVWMQRVYAWMWSVNQYLPRVRMAYERLPALLLGGGE